MKIIVKSEIIVKLNNFLIVAYWKDLYMSKVNTYSLTRRLTTVKPTKTSVKK